ncbi:hypothetical protein [Bacillus testis]|uniref:hypothetical protein n=1 Tax=Bacillus testis TaxID=1622072 RepID=UPI00067F6A2C|nr:hypothetical protein [Bacillus testis]
MKTIVASDITLKSAVPVRRLMEIYSEIKQWGGEVFFVQNRRMVSSSSLPKLLTFTLTVDAKAPVKMIVEGQKAEKMNEILKTQFEQSSTNNKAIEEKDSTLEMVAQ